MEYSDWAAGGIMRNAAAKMRKRRLVQGFVCYCKDFGPSSEIKPLGSAVQCSDIV